MKEKDSPSIVIGDQTISDHSPVFIIAEVAQAHEGSLGLAHSYIDAAAKAGADAVKFQTHITAAETTPLEPWRKKFSTQDATRWDYWKRMEFTPAQWRELSDHAREASLVFLSSPFSFEAVDLLENLGVAAWKIASGEVSNLPLIEYVASTRKPVLLSSGLSDWTELDAAVACVNAKGSPLGLFQCTSAYPCPPELVGLNNLKTFQSRYGLVTGLSDHSSTVFAGLAAATLGVSMIEVHVTFSKEMFGPDTSASLTFEELRQLRDGCDFIRKCTTNPTGRDNLTDYQMQLRAIFTKSIFLKRPLPSGTLLKASDLAYKKPGTGIPASRWNTVIGKRLITDLDASAPLQDHHLSSE